MFRRWFEHVREHWQQLAADAPGRRFKNRWRRHRKSSRSLLRRVLVIGLAVVSLAVGLVLSVMPGPAFVFFGVAGALLAEESFLVARLMDKIEVWCRQAWAAIQSRLRGTRRA